MKVKDLFILHQGNGFELYNMGQSEDSDVFFVSRTANNNGVVATVDRVEGTAPFAAGLITVALGGSVLSSFIQRRPFYTAFHIMVLEPRREMSFNEKLYYCMCIQGNRYRYSYGRQANKTLKDNFSGNAWICNPSNMPEFKIYYDKLCSIFHIKILTDADFTKRKDGKFFRDENAIREIRKRLLYLAYKTGKDNWKETFEEYDNRLKAADISQCERIAYSFNDNIETDLMVYAEDEKALWYVNSWTGPMFLEVLNWIENKIGLKGSFDNNFMRKLFLTPRPFIAQARAHQELLLIPLSLRFLW